MAKVKEERTYVTTVVDEACHVAVLRSVYDRVVVDAEQVTAAESHSLVLLLTLVGDGLPDHLTHVLHHHLVRGDRLQGEQAPVVDAAPAEVERLLTELQRNTT